MAFWANSRAAEERFKPLVDHGPASSSCWSLSCLTFLSDLQWTQPAGAQLPKSLQLNGQAMAVPAGDVVDLPAPQHLEPVTDVLDDLRGVGHGRWVS